MKNFYLAEPRTTVQVKFSDGQTYEGPIGSTVEDFVKMASFLPDLTPMACLVDGQLRELTYPVTRDVNIRILTLADSDGMRVYRRSLSLLLVAAAHQLFPQTRISIEYGLNFGALYCESDPPLSEIELKKLETRMSELVAANLPIHKEQISLAEAETLFKDGGLDDKLRLLKNRRKSYLTIYALGNYRDYLHGYVVPSTDYLKLFALDSYSNGFVLRFPRREKPLELQSQVDYPKLINVFDEYGDWMDKLGIRDVGTLNEVVKRDDLLETILVSEALQEQRVAKIATMLASSQGRVRLVLISGPSSSGKTTFSKRLAIQLLAHGIRPFALSLDDFLVERELNPRDEDGDYDYECIEAQNLELFNKTLLGLMRGEAVTLPRYNFLTGKVEQGETVSISSEHIIIVEGIHGLNPALVPYIPQKAIFRIYVSALTQLNLDRHNRIPSTDTRLLRRIVRDAKQRGYTAQNTISRWPKVRRGEYKWVFPFQENADVMFNSALIYELAIIKPQVEPLLLQIEPHTPEYVEAKRLLSFLQWFEPHKSKMVPANSLLREFIGKLALRSYKIGFK